MQNLIFVVIFGWAHNGLFACASLGTKKVMEFPCFIIEKSWNLEAQKEHKPCIRYGKLS